MCICWWMNCVNCVANVHLCRRRDSVRTKVWPSPVWTPPQIRAKKYFPLLVYHCPWKDHQLLFCLSLTLPCLFCDVNLVDLKKAVCFLTFPVNCFLHMFANFHRHSMEPACITYCICTLLSLILKVEAACSSGMLVSTCKVTQHTLKTMWIHTARKNFRFYFLRDVYKHTSGILDATIKLDVSYGQMFQLLWQLYGEAEFFHFSWFCSTCGKKVNTNVRHSSVSHKGHTSFYYETGCL